VRRKGKVSNDMGNEEDVTTAQHPVFEPVPLPSLPPGELSSARLGPVLREWASSSPLRALAQASGWDWPSCPGTDELLIRLAELSRDWDFRALAGGKERNFIEAAPVEVNGQVIPEDLITAAAQALGLVEATPVPAEQFTSLVVLSGLARACVNRTRHAAELLRDGVKAETAVVLGGHRQLAGEEPAQARELGLGDMFDEADVVLAATRQAFGLAAPAETEESATRPPAWDNALWAASARYRWPGVEVVIVPSSEPADRRVNTQDQLRYWAGLASIGGGDRVLLLTTQIYVPFQQLVGLRVLGLERGCRVYCCGVDAASSLRPGLTFSGRNYLQEIRSTLRAAAELMMATGKADG
jgi:hypothetical protein